MVNQEIKAEAVKAGIKLWQIAEAIGLSDSNFSRKLRHELPEDDKQRILSVIADLQREGRSA